jgi:hypothetical protein
MRLIATILKKSQKLTGAALDKAKEFINNGGAIDTIKKKYNVSKEIELSLTKLK